MNEPLPALLRRAAAIQDRGGRVIACLVVGARGSTPQSAGALMLVDDAARTFGSIGGGCIEAETRGKAHAMLGRGESGLLHLKLDHDYGWDDGLICGGSVTLALAPLPPRDLLIETASAIEARKSTSLELHVQTEEGVQGYRMRINARPRLYIAGAGHVGQAVARHGARLEFDVTLFDDRADMLQRFAPPEVKQMSGDIATQLTKAPIDDETFCVIVTRGHRHDEQALAAVLGTRGRGAKYVGMIGSRRKIKLIFDDLVERGIARDLIETVHAPIGLDIGAVTIEEISLAIAAEIVHIRRTSPHRIVEGPFPTQKNSGKV